MKSYKIRTLLILIFYIQISIAQSSNDEAREAEVINFQKDLII